MYAGPGSAKQVTRRRVRRARAARGVATATRTADDLAARVEELLRLSPADGPGPLTVAAYVSLPGEPGTGPLRARLAALGHRVLLPWLQDDRDLDWVPDDLAGTTEGAGTTDQGDPMRPGGARLGPGAVADVDLVLVPALAVDAAGTRLGQGGGSYDRALARLPRRDGATRRGPLVVAVVHDDELLPAGGLPREPHDVAVDAVLTASAVRLVDGPLSRLRAAPAAPGPARPRPPA